MNDTHTQVGRERSLDESLNIGKQGKGAVCWYQCIIRQLMSVFVYFGHKHAFIIHSLYCMVLYLGFDEWVLIDD